MIQVEELVPEHLEHMKLRKYETDTMEAMHTNLRRMIEAATMGPAFAFVKDGEVLAIAGLANLWGKVWEAWLFSAEGMEAHGCALAFRIIKKFRAVEEELGPKIQRIQAQAPVTHPSAHRWIKWLGFEFESVAKKYSALGEDSVIYARIK